MNTVSTWRKYADSYDARKRPRCHLCRQQKTLLIVCGHTLPPAKKRGVAGGVKRLGLCRYCIFSFAREASLLESHVRPMGDEGEKP